jgi:serine/threonine protein kinase
MEASHGKLLGRYEIVTEIGRGSMGTVYKARDPKIDRFVAIKTILLHQSGVQEQREFRDRFFVEAQAAGRLHHPGIVTVFDVGEDPETADPYIVMEYIEGKTLGELLAQNNKRLPLDQALQIAMEVAEALDYAHTQGVVHRDIKPANILITKEGQAKIGDFGIAQLDLSHITLPGHVIGTPAYMSPEQLEGQPVDGRSDLFSLGAILYSAVTGFSPFQGNSTRTVCFKVANHEPLQASALAPELPPELDEVISRALAKDPAQRYQRGTEFANDLRGMRDRTGSHAKGKLWFSQSDGRKRFLDGTIKIATMPATSAPVPKTSPRAPVKATSKALPATPKTAVANTSLAAVAKARQSLSVFSSSKVQTGTAVTLFLAAIVLNFVAWRQIHRPRVTPAPVVETENRPQVEDAQQKPVSKPAGKRSEIPISTQMKPATAASAKVPKATVPSASKPDAQAIQRSSTASPAVAKDVVQAVPRIVVPPASKLGSKPAVVGAATQPVPEVQQNAAPPPRPSAPAVDSILAIRIENHFSDANLTIWIDNKLAYDHALRDGHKKRLILLGGGAKENLTIPLSSGQHTLRVQVQSAAEQYDETKSIDGEFPKAGQKVLAITFEKHTKAMRMALASE